MDFGKYLLIEKIGEGGLGEVFFAQSSGSSPYSREMVIKRVHRRLTQDPDFVGQFQLAAEQGSCLNHHNIAQTYESGIIDGQHYVAQEYIEGLTLEEILDRHERRLQAIPIEITLEIILQVCEAMTYAYWARDDRGRQLHMVHRNLKPSNIMINKHGVVKVIDFGLINAGQTMGAGQGSLVLRMAAYMSPEQAKGEEVDNRSDIFSLGAVFYELLTLKPLFCMDNPLQTLRMVQEGRCEEQLRELSKHPVGQGLLPLLKSMLGASPWDRPTEPKQLIPHLRAVLGRLSQQVYLPNWIQEEMAATPRTARGGKPTVSMGSPGGTAPSPTAATTTGQIYGTAVVGGSATVRHPTGPVAASPFAAAADTGSGWGGKSPAVGGPPAGTTGGSSALASIQHMLGGLPRKYLAVGGAVLAVLVVGLIALLAFGTGSSEASKAALARLRITSTPPGALVFVPGEGLPRTTPFEIDVPAQLGYVDLRAQLEGYEAASTRVILRPEVLNQYTFVLNSAEEETATLEVSVYPPDAQLTVNGKVIEGTPPYQMEVRANLPNVLKVAREGYAAREEVVKVDPQGFRKLSIALDLLPEIRQ